MFVLDLFLGKCLVSSPLLELYIFKIDTLSISLMWCSVFNQYKRSWIMAKFYPNACMYNPSMLACLQKTETQKQQGKES